MRQSKVLTKIRAGKVARICVIGSNIGMAPALAAHFNYDGMWVDAEHRVWEPREIEAMMGRHYEADIDCIWRPPTKQKNELYRLLEDGASALMLPHVSTAEEARELVRAVKFPPLGDRGYDCAGRDANYLIGAPKDYVTRANRETGLIVQIETTAALENVDAIAAVPGVDILFVGPGDLSLRLGCAPGVTDPIMMQAQLKIADAARNHGKAWGRPVGSIEDVRVLIGIGAQFIVHGGEFGALHKHFSDCAADLDEVLGVGVSGLPFAELRMTASNGKGY